MTIRRTGTKGGLFKTTPPPPDPIHKEAYRLVEAHYFAIKGRTGKFSGRSPTELRGLIDDAEQVYQASKQRLIDAVEKGLRANDRDPA